jgi:hypothetical protein
MRQISGEKLQMLYNFYRDCGTRGHVVAMRTAGSIPDEAIGNDAYEECMTYYPGPYNPRMFVWWVFKGHSEGCGPYSDKEYENTPTSCSFPASWFDSHIEQATQRLRSVPAHGQVKELVVRPDAISKCALCQSRALEDLADYSELLAAAIKDAHEDVRRSNWFYFSI